MDDVCGHVRCKHPRSQHSQCWSDRLGCMKSYECNAEGCKCRMFMEVL
jgi:hypothetical protein